MGISLPVGRRPGGPRAVGYARRVDVAVLVAGAGPVGLTLACELERRGVDCRIVDAAPERAVVSRATDLHGRSLELWDHTGVADAILDAAVPITGAPLFSDGREVARLDFAGIDSPFPAAVSLRQRDLESLLEARLGREVERGAAVELAGQDDEAVALRLGTEELRARFLVACDGVHSGLRDALGIAFEGGEYPGRWAVMDAELEGWPYGPGEIPVFLDHDGFWAMPLPGGALRLFFRDDDAGDVPEVGEAQAVIDRHVPGGARIRQAENRACFRLHHRVAGSFRAGRVLLAGDAAHAMTPVNGQGMNTGVQDAYNLAWKLDLALGGAPSAVLDSYEAERRPVAVTTVHGSGEVHDANVLAGEAAAARDRALAAALATPAPVLAAVEAGHELGVAYPDSPIVDAAVAAGAPGVAPGARVPDAGPLVEAGGSVTSLRELLRAAEPQLWLCAGGAGPAAALSLAGRFAPAVRTRVFVIADRPPPGPSDVELLADPALRVHGRLGAVSEAAYVVRPDGYLGFRCEPPEAERLADHLGLLGLS
jgi:2-polyprenyl-6-methoxyphenol hydroxylase-like FAD-dependent oxidoreductase